MASMHGRTNEWHGIKTKKRKDKLQSTHVKDKQAREQSKQKLLKYKTYEAKNETEELGFLGNGLQMQTEAYVRRPNPMYTGFDLPTHAYGTDMQSCSKPKPRNKLSRKQSTN